jgi:hypothetical protein
MGVECVPVPVNLIEDPLHWRVRHKVNDVHDSTGLCGPDLLRRLLSKPVEIGDPVLKEGENQDPAIRPRGRGRG